MLFQPPLPSDKSESSYCSMSRSLGSSGLRCETPTSFPASSNKLFHRGYTKQPTCTRNEDFPSKDIALMCRAHDYKPRCL